MVSNSAGASKTGSPDPTPADEMDIGLLRRGDGMLPIVGLGGSAGGIAALQQFFAAMPADSGMAFVVILHLSPTHESVLAEMFQRSTAMPVVAATDGVTVEPNSVYVIPPGKFLASVDGHLSLTEPEEHRGKRVAVDHFFRTLAETHGAQSLAVVLSGAGGDGALGLKRVKELGGLTIAQDPDEAEHPDMPRAAIATGVVDWVLGVKEMPGKLLAYMKQRRELRLTLALQVPGRVAVENVRAGLGQAAAFDGGLLPGELHYRLIERFSPPSVLVNAAHDIVHLSESAGRFLKFAGGEPTRNLLRTVHPMLRVELRAALYAAAQTHTVATAFRVPVETGDAGILVDIRVTPAGDLAPDFLLVVFEEHPADGATAVAVPRSADADQAVLRLERELVTMKAQLRDTVEEAEASTEELKASNEELQAMNEELRSTTEELETSRDELKSKVDQLARSNSDLQNLMAATEIATLFLDRGLRIQRFTPSARALFHFIATDLGRPLADLSHTLDYPDIVADAERSLAHLQPTQREVRVGERWYLARTLPYRTDDDHIAGVVLTFLDITEQKQAEAELRASEDRYRTLLERIPDPLFVYDRETLGYLAVNDAAVSSYGYTRDEFLRMTLKDIPPAGDVPALLQMLNRSTGGFEDRGRWRHLKKDGTVMDVEITAHDLRVGGRPACIILARNVTARLLAEQALHLRDRAIRAVVGGVIIADATRPDHPIIYTSPGFERLTGYTGAEVVGRNCRFLQGPATDRHTVSAIRAAVGAGLDWSGELLNYRKDGTAFWNALSISPVRNDGDELTHFVGVQTDATGRRQLEEQFQQAQKMEAVGQLAGGVAHDFNNLLTVITGYGEIVHDALPPDHPSRGLVAEIMKAGERATSLTRQLLAFSRQSVLEPKVLDPNALVQNVERLLRRLIGEDIDLATRLTPDVGRVRADPGQLEQAVVNLCVNARDAMPTGGKLTIETGDVELDDAYPSAQEHVRPGSYVLVAVADTGTGMTREVQNHIFEPFFTTKEVGKGTGLGLAMVYGFVKQSGGHVAVSSEPGRGTTFKLYLPRVADAPLAGESAVRRMPMPLGTETVLLVEDEDAVRALGRHILGMCGYTVLEAGNGEEAVGVADGHAGPIHLLLTDVVMPGGMGGRQVAEAIVARHTGIKVLFTSGYTDDAVVRHGVLEEGTHFLQKPFTPATFAGKVRDVLDGKG